MQTGATVGIYDTSSASVVPFNADGTQGTPGSAIPWTYGINASGSAGCLQIDLDGDGLPDTACYIASVPSSTGTWQVWLTGSGSFPDRLQSVTDGIGLTTQWTYTSGNDTSVVTAGTPGAYPTKNVHVTAPVVSRMSVDADSAQSATTIYATYKYNGMRSDLRGRGSLGFDTVTSTDSATGIVTTTQYSQSFPTIASELVETKTGGGVTLHNEVSTWASLSTQSGLNVLYPYVRTKVTSGQDLDGSWLPKTTTQVGTLGGTDGIDAYGNIATAKTISAENNGTRRFISGHTRLFLVRK